MQDRSFITPTVFMRGFDILRVASAFTVVYIHGAVSNSTLSSLANWSVFAVPSFFLMAGFLTARGLEFRASQSFLQFSTMRVERVLPAYLAWSLLYLGLRTFKLRVLEGSSWQSAVSIDWATWLLLGGYTYHLWFLPTLLYLSITLYLIVKYTLNFSPLARIGALIGLAIFTFLIYSYALNQVAPVPSVANYLTRYFLRNAGFVFLGAALFFVLRNNTSWRHQVKLVAGVAWLIVILLAAGFFAFRTDTVWIIAISLAAFSSAILVTNKTPALVKKVSAVSFGIYLVHAVFLESFRVALGMANIQMTAVNTSGLILAAFFASTAFSLHVARIERLKWLVS